MRRFILVAICIASTPIYSISQEIVAAQGGSYQNFYGQIDYTVGELVISSLNTGSFGLTQGFHQTNLTISSVADFSKEWEVNVYPNPVIYTLNIHQENLEPNSQIDLLDLNGKRVKHQILKDVDTEISVSDLAAGVYILVLKSAEGQKQKTYQIHKLN